MISKIRDYFRENRFLVYLLTVCVIVALFLFKISRAPQSKWEVNLRDLASNLSAGIIGAAITVFFIDWLLKKHLEQGRKGIQYRIQERVFSLGYETIALTVCRVPQPKFDSIDSYAQGELIELTYKHDISSSISILDKVFLSPSLVHPVIYGLMFTLTSQLLQDWKEFYDQFRDYLTTKQIEGILDIIKLLERMVSSNKSMSEIVEELDIENDMQKVDKMARSEASENLTSSVKELCSRVLNTLNLFG